MRKLYASLGMGMLVSALSAEPSSAAALENVLPSGDSIQHQTPSGTKLYFPDYVDGGWWSIQLALSNLNPSRNASVVVTAYDPQGREVSELFDSGSRFEIPARGSRVLRSAGTGSAARRGWIEVKSETASVRGLLTYREAGTGIEVGVEPVRLRDHFALFVEESSGIGTGLAIFKPEASPEIEFRIRDEAGMDPLGEALMRGDFQQRARTLAEWFQGTDPEILRDFRGLLFLRTADGSSFAPLGLRFGKRQGSLSAVPVIPIVVGAEGRRSPQPSQATEDPLYFPDYVEGEGWSVQLVLGNLDPDRSAPVVVEVYDSQGQSVSRFFDSENSFEIPALGSQLLRNAGAGAIRRGWIEVKADPVLVTGLLIYRNSLTGIEVGVDSVELGDHFALFVEESTDIGTGLAILKPDSSSEIELLIRDEEGRDPLGGVFVPREDFHQRARTIPEWFDVDGVDTEFLKDFRGLLFLRTEDGSPFAPLGLRFGKRKGSLSAVPVVKIPEPPPMAVSVEVSGMASLTSIGETIQLSVTANMSDGSRQAVENELVQWQSSDLAVAMVLEGAVTAVGGGNATITADYEGLTADAPMSVHISVRETGTVRVLYAVPTDREFRSDYREAIQHAIVDLQSWYRRELGGLTFSLYNATPEQCQLSEAEDFYGRYSWQKVVDGVQHCAPVEGETSAFTWVVYVDVELECAPDGSEGDWDQGYDQLGRGGVGLTILSRKDMDGLIGEKILYYACSRGPVDGPVERWIGGLGHELGHTFGLPHPPGCDEGLATCDYGALMAYGWAAGGYPDTYLRPDEKAILRSSPFIGRN